jgi:hypothetical protein
MDALLRTSLALVRSVFPVPKGVRLLGVGLSNFHGDVATDATQLSFDLS